MRVKEKKEDSDYSKCPTAHTTVASVLTVPSHHQQINITAAQTDLGWGYQLRWTTNTECPWLLDYLKGRVSPCTSQGGRDSLYLQQTSQPAGGQSALPSHHPRALATAMKSSQKMSQSLHVPDALSGCSVQHPDEHSPSTNKVLAGDRGETPGHCCLSRPQILNSFSGYLNQNQPKSRTDSQPLVSQLLIFVSRDYTLWKTCCACYLPLLLARMLSVQQKRWTALQSYLNQTF